MNLTLTHTNLFDDLSHRFTESTITITADFLEQQLLLTPEICQIAVLMHHQPRVCAVIFSHINPRPRHTRKINASIKSLNKKLPENLRIKQWIYADFPFLIKNHQMACSGRLCKDQIYHDYRYSLET